MNDVLTREGLAWIIESILENVKETINDHAGSKNDEFYEGKMQGFYEVLEIIKSRIEIRGGDPDEYGLSINLEKLEEEIKKREKIA